MRMSIDEIIEHCRNTCHDIEETAKIRRREVESKTYREHFSTALYLEELLTYQATGLTPSQIIEIDRLYREKCEELGRVKKKLEGHGGDWIFCSKKLPSSRDSYIVLLNLFGLQYTVSVADYDDRMGWNIKAPVIAWMPKPDIPEVDEILFLVKRT